MASSAESAVEIILFQPSNSTIKTQNYIEKFKNKNTKFIYFLLCFSISSQFLVFFCVHCWRNNSALFYIVRVVTSRNEYQISEFDKDVEVGSGR